MSRITAVFHNESEVRSALQDLRNLGISDQHLSFSHRGEQGSGEAVRPDPDGTVSTDGNYSGYALRREPLPYLVPPIANAGVPMGVGGLGSPGVGAVLVAGAMHDRLDDNVNPVQDHGGDPDRESRFYRDAFDNGRYLISVDAEDSVQEEQVRDILGRHHGGFYTP
ncbi:hypothetical protein [Deinococcus cellulosilyticus]|uniref:General stress protein 17M-like domain-containing protein n=1 Tax=Deinococcus cellulosilyticus (strain DSM 18568 / NBRC 106333 / KACC 11606 / 5516J-15) TaxID=1223518 RepID=A0A511N645_DEIC1|nr:hypothetical protein [Deinococcus cellulosilyticus]GEM48314.1 hypothetical protein DC3_39490 [Deinococcus cellulosilyticus NBRC 106333 = KACC 11606]